MPKSTSLPYPAPFRYTRPAADLQAMFGAQTGNPPVLPEKSKKLAARVKKPAKAAPVVKGTKAKKAGKPAKGSKAAKPAAARTPARKKR